jgi:hypothetical protein
VFTPPVDTLELLVDPFPEYMAKHPELTKYLRDGLLPVLFDAAIAHAGMPGSWPESVRAMVREAVERATKGQP